MFHHSKPQQKFVTVMASEDGFRSTMPELIWSAKQDQIMSQYRDKKL